MTNMEKDSQRARGKFISKTNEIREELCFAHPEQIMQAVQLLCTDAYGSMLWKLSSTGAESFFKSLNRCVKLVHGIPRNTFIYLVEGYFASSQSSLRNQILSRYFLLSPSKEVRFLAKVVSIDPRSSTCLNLRYLSQMTELTKPEFMSSARIRMALPVKIVPDSEKWRLGLLASLKKLKAEKYHKVEDYQHICAMMDSLCST